MDGELDYKAFNETFADAVAVVDDLLLNQPLYAVKDFEKDVRGAAVVYQIDQGELNFDCYCTDCGRHSVFRRSQGETSFAKYIEHNPFARINGGREDIVQDVMARHQLFTVMVICQRDNRHGLIFMVSADAGRIQKIGQLPSLEDIAGADIERFRGVLGKEYYQELRRAGGLASHGIGIGSFVYLRRIFEKLILEHHKLYTETLGEIEGFSAMRMDEKITALAPVMPPAVVEFKGAYGILSKGLHELDEATCKKHFPVVRAAIIAILEQDLQEKEKRKAQDALRAEMARITGEVRSKI